MSSRLRRPILVPPKAPLFLFTPTFNFNFAALDSDQQPQKFESPSRKHPNSLDYRLTAMHQNLLLLGMGVFTSVICAHAQLDGVAVYKRQGDESSSIGATPTTTSATATPTTTSQLTRSMKLSTLLSMGRFSPRASTSRG